MPGLGFYGCLLLLRALLIAVAVAVLLLQIIAHIFAKSHTHVPFLLLLGSIFTILPSAAHLGLRRDN